MGSRFSHLMAVVSISHLQPLPPTRSVYAFYPGWRAMLEQLISCF